MKLPIKSLAVAFALTGFVASAVAVEPTGKTPNATGWKKTTVVKGLENPWGLAFLPNGEMLVTERPGRVRLVRDGKLVEEPINGVPVVYAQGQGGLMDIALHPKFETNKTVYLTYSTGNQSSNRTVLARGTFDGTSFSDMKEILVADPSKSGGQHFGSVLQFLPDGTLLVSIGDGGNPPNKIGDMLAREQAQNLGSHYGKVLRVNEDGTVPKDNPFVAQEGAKPEIFSYGHRNIQGITIDTSGTVWTTEHGPRGGDELNLTEKGKNYGWPKVSHGNDYKTNEPVASARAMPGMVDPKTVWTPSTGASGLAFYTGDKFPAWKGNIFAGGLALRDIRRVKLDGTNVTGEETLAIGKRVREVLQGPDGFLYVLTDEKDGEVLRIEPE